MSWKEVKFACDNNFTTHVLLTNRRDHIDFKIAIKKSQFSCYEYLELYLSFPHCVWYFYWYMLLTMSMLRPITLCLSQMRQIIWEATCGKKSMQLLDN